MPHVPTKRCDRLERHDPHPWKEGAFKRECLGRTTTKQRSRNVRRREAKQERRK